MMTRTERATAAHGLAFAAAAGDPPVALAEEGAGPGGGGGDLAEDAVQPGVPWPALPPLVFFPGWRVAGQRFAQDTSRPGVPKTAISRPISAMTAWAAMTPQPVMASSCATADSTGESGLVPACGPVVPSASTPQAAGIWLISSPIVPVSCSVCRFRASMLSSRIRGACCDRRS